MRVNKQKRPTGVGRLLVVNLKLFYALNGKEAVAWVFVYFHA